MRLPQPDISVLRQPRFRTAILCHLPNIAMLTGRPMRWDSEKELILDDPEASKLVLPAIRGEWKI